MPWPLDDKLKIGANKDVIAFIQRVNPSAHDDVASALTDSATGLSDVKSYCPDLHAYAYVVLHTQANRIFGIAFGMNALVYRLPADVLPEALAEGGKAYEDIGADWVLFEPWNQPMRLRHWCKVAHDAAVKSA
jgi:hypothetical protein